VSMASASSVPYPSSKESTNASFEGSSSTCSAPAGFEGAPEGSPWFEGVSLGVDGRFCDIPRKDVRGNGDSPRRDLGEFIRLLVVLAGNVIELDAVELVLEGSHGIAVVLTVKIRQPSHEFTFGVGISFIPCPLVLTPVV
jgi:hypothetical protein